MPRTMKMGGMDVNFPAAIMEITAANAQIFEADGEQLRKFVMCNVTALIFCAPYLLIRIGTSLAKERRKASIRQPSPRQAPTSRHLTRISPN